jgi:hypothetical protein
MPKNIVKAIPIAVVDAATFAGTYVPINPLGLPEACFSLRILNDSDQNLVISFDGIVDNFIMLDNTEIFLPFQNFSSPNNHVCQMPVGTKIYVKALAGTGFVSLSGFYQPN